MELSPIGLSVYSRLPHIKKTVTSLSRNKLASESILFIFSDGPQRGDEEKVRAVRRYLRTISGFKEIHIIERDRNSRVENNRNGIRRLLDEYGKIIYLEEDIVTAPKFIDFMNKALDFYRNDPRIISVTGYSPPIILPSGYVKDIYLSLRFSAWGFGIWKDRYDKIKMKIEGYDNFHKDPKALKRFRMGGEDLMELLRLEFEGKIDALDVKIMFQQFQQNLYTLAPARSLVQNTGHDGTGVHCTKTDKYSSVLDMSERTLRMEENIEPDQDLLNRLYEFRSGGIKAKLERVLKRTALLPLVKFARTKIARLIS